MRLSGFVIFDFEFTKFGLSSFIEKGHATARAEGWSHAPFIHWHGQNLVVAGAEVVGAGDAESGAVAVSAGTDGLAPADGLATGADEWTRKFDSAAVARPLPFRLGPKRLTPPPASTASLARRLPPSLPARLARRRRSSARA